MPKRKIAVGIFTKSGQQVFTTTVEKVGQDMDDNTHFTGLASETTAMRASFELYKTARANAVHGGVEATAIRNAAGASWSTCCNRWRITSVPSLRVVRRCS